MTKVKMVLPSLAVVSSGENLRMICDSWYCLGFSSCERGTGRCTTLEVSADCIALARDEVAGVDWSFQVVGLELLLNVTFGLPLSGTA
jgi:hypothetical protein